MKCKLCGRERPIKFFPKRVIEGTGQVLRICSECGPVDIKRLAEEVANKLDVDIDCSSYIRVR
jgi:uncharacterized Zn finger protein